MNGRQAVDGLDLHDHLVVDDQIGPMFGNQLSLVIEGYSELSFERQRVGLELDAQRDS